MALGLGHVIVREGWHDEAWLTQYTVGWPEFRERLSSYTPERVAAVTGVSMQTIEDLAQAYATTRPSLLKFADGIQRHRHGGQTVRTLCALPALTGQYGVRGGGLSYSTSGYGQWNPAALGHAAECPPLGRVVNMNRLGAGSAGRGERPAAGVALCLWGQSGYLQPKCRGELSKA